MTHGTKRATVVASHTYGKNARKSLSANWKNAAGMMRHHKRGLDRYISRVRKEWQ